MQTSLAEAIRFGFDNSYARLPERFFAKVEPANVTAPRIVKFNEALAQELGLTGLQSEEGAQILAGNLVPEGASPIATAYAGHQFGGFVPQLGDGRAILLGEVVTPSGQRFDLQLKGSGQTPFSRRGDGRAALGPVLREYLISEAMKGLGIPTTRSLAAVATGEPVYRETTLPGAVLTRVAASHIRVGTFQYFAARGDTEGVRTLADHVITRHYLEIAGAERPYLALLDQAAERQASLVAKWMMVGFIHGVMNTDNMAISGETIDFGPCAFMNAYDPGTVFSSIDETGRYAYGNQPAVAQWNLARLAETFLPLIDPDHERAVGLATESITLFASRYMEHWLQGMRQKLGLFTSEEGDLALAEQLLSAMQTNRADYTLLFRKLGKEDARELFIDPTRYDEWEKAWRERLSHEPQSDEERQASMDKVNPAVIPRNHRVEEALSAAAQDGDLGPFDALLAALSNPYAVASGALHLMEPPENGDMGYRTFCGT